MPAFITKRVLSLCMVFGVGCLIVASLALSAAIAAFGSLAGPHAAGLLYASDLITSFVVLTVLFALLFKVLPDIAVAWNDAWVGSLVTTLLFILGKFPMGIYLGRSRPGDVFGAASALAVIFVWVYYGGLILSSAPKSLANALH